MSIVIKVENLSKQYRLGTIGTGSLAHDINRWWYKFTRKENPYIKIGEENDRTIKRNGEYMWALSDINFEVKRGEVLGIIGRNGAGKSTLLKILSRTTAPTIGQVKLKGRVASLLEVGTGFHPELTGMENVFLNGAIMGMTKNEIKRKFDEIVDFSGVEKYINTPVKRYSSGMYVRLAFAVAAYLESEILIVDEVLAVGDAEFQKKCLGKMGEVSRGEGKTVLFVSHNMPSIVNLCTNSILLKFGKVAAMGSTREIIEKYIHSGLVNSGSKGKGEIAFTSKNPNIEITKISLCGKNGISNEFGLDEQISCKIEFCITQFPTRIVAGLHLLDKYGECILSTLNSDSAVILEDPLYDKVLQKGPYISTCIIPSYFLNDTIYKINVLLADDESFINVTKAEEVLSFDMYDTSDMKKKFTGTWRGLIRPKLFWSTVKNALEANFTINE